MHALYTHPLEVAGAYILIGIGVAWYLGREKSDVRTIAPGREFGIAVFFKILSLFVFLGLPATLIFLLPEAAHPNAAVAMILAVSVFCLSGVIAIFTARLKIIEGGFETRSIGFVSRYSFSAFGGVSSYRYNMVLERTDGGPNVVVPILFSEGKSLCDYFKEQIDHGRTS